MKKASLASLITVVLFVSVTFSVSKFTSPFQNYTSFGWPLVFFYAEPEKQIMAERYFSLFNLLLDILLYSIISFVLIKTVWIKRGKKYLA